MNGAAPMPIPPVPPVPPAVPPLPVAAVPAAPQPPRALTIEVQHDTRYDYAQPVSQSHHVAYLTPLADDHQQVLLLNLHIEPSPVSRHRRTDIHGNRSVHFALTQPHRELRVGLHTRVRVVERFTALRSDASPPWEQLRDRLRYVARGPFDPAVAYVQPSPLVPRLDALRAYAKPSFAPGRPVASAAIELMRRIHADFAYRSQSTQVDTPLEKAFAQRSGVCQDFAQILIGACRMLGLPARYVSGYLLTHSAQGGEALVGADASHAWVQVYAPGTPGVPADGWLDLDPTNDRIPGVEHVRLAVGRDFADVTPLRGVVRGGGRHVLRVGVTTRAVNDNPEAEAA
jgi:transglutaminase-like putative cysteine protease